MVKHVYIWVCESGRGDAIACVPPAFDRILRASAWLRGGIVLPSWNVPQVAVSSIEAGHDGTTVYVF